MKNEKSSIIIGILLFGAIFTLSRTSYVALIFLFLIEFIFDQKKIKEYFLGISVVFAILLLCNYIVIFAGPILKEFGIFVESAIAVRSASGVPDGSDVLRWETLVRGWDLFLNYPVFGAGLGVNMFIQAGGEATPSVIHNSYLWLLAEFGILGFLLFLSPIIVIGRHIVQAPEWIRSRQGKILIACILVMAVYSLAHEVAYQRIFWFMLGLLAANAGSLRSVKLDIAKMA